MLPWMQANNGFEDPGSNSVHGSAALDPGEMPGTDG
jgi:hypothetical protein